MDEGGGVGWGTGSIQAENTVAEDRTAASGALLGSRHGKRNVLDHQNVEAEPVKWNRTYLYKDGRKHCRCRQTMQGTGIQIGKTADAERAQGVRDLDIVGESSR